MYYLGPISIHIMVKKFKITKKHIYVQFGFVGSIMFFENSNLFQFIIYLLPSNNFIKYYYYLFIIYAC